MLSCRIIGRRLEAIDKYLLDFKSILKLEKSTTNSKENNNGICKLLE